MVSLSAAALTNGVRLMTKDVHLDALIHQPVRLRIMTALYTLAPDQEMEFTALRDLLGLTDGNLSIHLRKLEEAGYIRAVKTFVQRKPRTYLSLTPEGRQAYEGYLKALQDLLPIGVQK